MGKTDTQREFRFDYGLLLSFIVLTVLGILTIYSAGTGGGTAGAGENEYVKQIYWAVTGLVVFILLLFINYQKLGEYAVFIYIGCLLLLIFTLIIGKRVRGAKSWITLFGGFGFQPSEFVKIGVIIVLARYLDRIGEEIKTIKHVCISLLITLVPMGLILLQPDFGTALVYIPIVLTMLFFSGMKYAHLISILIILGIAIVLPLLVTFSSLTGSESIAFLKTLDDTKAVLLVASVFGALSFVFFVLYKVTKKDIFFKAMSIFLIFFAGLALAAVLGRFLKSYQRKRLIVFLKPSIDPYGSGYNIIQSKIAVGAGGLFGKGLFGGTQSQLGFLPERSTDFIFSIFAEEWGFVGSFFIIVLYGAFVFRGIMIMLGAKDRFGSLVASGVTGMFLFHIIINIGMTIGLMPITGIPLPFLSYGGSFLITSMVGASLLFNIASRRYAR
ncbi:MAG: rod shape-determining protein RodA [Spirochaetes bacterium]|nr:rod shape-determining protein RodA [Spirochaetota bacterium]